jgi:hypothetical protein
MTKKKATKQTERPVLPYDIGKIVDDYIVHNCIPLHTMDFTSSQEATPYSDCELRIVLHADGKGYIHLIGQDSQTVNFDLDSREARTQLQKPNYYTDRGLEKINTAAEHLRNVIRKEMDEYKKSK